MVGKQFLFLFFALSAGLEVILIAVDETDVGAITCVEGSRCPCGMDEG